MSFPLYIYFTLQDFAYLFAKCEKYDRKIGAEAK